jgi:transposase
VLKHDPLSGHLFVFRNRARDRLKVMYWDGDGLAIWYKRLERGTFQLPTDLQSLQETQVDAEISVSELNLLLGGIDLTSVKRRRRYQRPDKPR